MATATKEKPESKAAVVGVWPVNPDSVFKFQPIEGVEEIMTKSKVQLEKLASDAASTSKDNLDAFIKSSTIAAKGFEGFFKAYTTYAQEAAEKNAQAFKTLLSSKTITEFTEVQNKIAQDNLEDFLSNATKFSELSVKLATEAFEPLNEQVSKSLRKTTDSLAA